MRKFGIIFWLILIALPLRSHAQTKDELARKALIAKQDFLPTFSSPFVAEASGNVIDQSGQELSDVTVVFMRSSSSNGNSEELKHLSHGITDKTGKFNFFYQPNYSSYYSNYDSLVAFKEGYAPSLIAANEQTKTIRLEKGRSLTGLVTTESGAPIEGALVTFSGWFQPLKEPIKYPGRLPWNGEYFAGSTKNLSDQIKVKTDQNGAWRLDCIPSDFTAIVDVDCEGYLSKKMIFPGNGPSQFESELFSTAKWGDAFELIPTGAMSIQGVDFEQNPVAIKTVRRSAPGTKTRSYRYFSSHEPSLFNIVKGDSVLVIEPIKSGKYLGKELNVQVNDTNLIEKQIEFSEGVTVSGNVADLFSGEGVSGAIIRYVVDSNPETIKPFEAGESNDIPVDVRTDVDGNFAIAIPKVSGYLRVVGPVKGYRTVSSFTRVTDKEFRELFERRIVFDSKKPDELPKQLEFNFELEKASRVAGIARDKDGKIISNAFYLVRRHYSTTDRFYHQSEFQVVGKTDQDGRFEFNWFYHDAAELELAIQQIEANKAKPAAPPNGKVPPGKVPPGNAPPKAPNQKVIPQRAAAQRVSRSQYPAKMMFFHQERSLGAVAQIPIPVEAEDPIKFEVELAPLASVVGQFVDADSGDPISGVRIQCSVSEQGSYRVLITTSNDQGFFKLTGVNPDARVYASLQSENTKFVRSISIGGLEAGKVQDLGKIEGLNLANLLDPMPVLEIESLENEEALALIVRFINEQFDRVPWDRKLFFQSRSSTDVIGSFIQKIYEAVGTPSQELAARAPGSEFEAKVYTEVLAALNNPNNRYSYSYLNTTWVKDAFEVLLENHVDRNSVKTIVKDIVKRNYYQLERSGKNPWQQIMENSDDWELRGYACYQLAQRKMSSLISSGLNTTLSDEGFSELLRDAQKYAQLAMTTYSAADYTVNNSVGDMSLRQLQNIRRMAMGRKNLGDKLKVRQQIVLDFVEVYLDRYSGG